jgi:hypothetical protein
VYSLTRGRCLGLALGSLNMLIGVLRAAALTAGLSVFLTTLEGTGSLLLLVLVAGVSFTLAPSLDALNVATGATSEPRRGTRLSGAVDGFASFGGWDLEELPAASLPTRSESLFLDVAASLMATLDWDFFRAVDAFEDLGRDVTTVVDVSRQ